VSGAGGIRFRGGWVRSPLWDGFWMLSGLWLALLVWVLTRGDGEAGFARVDALYLVLSLAFWIGHRVSSTYLAYCTSAYRPLLSSQRTRFVWVPLGIVVVVLAILLPPDDALPWTRLQRAMALGILDYGLVTYHFAAQHYGCLSLYRVRAGQSRTVAARRVDRVYALGVGGLLVVVAEVVAGAVAFQSVWVDPVLDPVWLSRVEGVVRPVVLALVAAAFLVLLVLEVRTRAPSLARIAYALGMAVLVVAAINLDFFLFVVLWTAQHWLVAMGLATLVARREPDPGPSRWYRLWHAVNRRALAVVLLLAAVSVVLSPWMEVEALADGDEAYGLRVFPFLADVLADARLVPFLVAIGFVTAFVHYALDRAVYRLSDPAVREAAGGLFDPCRPRPYNPAFPGSDACATSTTPPAR